MLLTSLTTAAVGFAAAAVFAMIAELWARLRPTGPAPGRTTLAGR